MPDGCGQGEDALGDSGDHAGWGAALVVFQVQLVLEGVEDGLDSLAQGSQHGLAGSGGLAARGGAHQGHSPLVELGLQLLGAVALVGQQGLPAGGGQAGQHVEQDLALVVGGAGQRPGHGQPVGGGDHVQAQAPEPPGVRGAVPVPGPPCQVRASDRGAGAGALHGRGVGQPQVLAPGAGGPGQRADQPGHGGLEGAQALVPPRLAGNAGEHA